MMELKHQVQIVICATLLVWCSHAIRGLPPWHTTLRPPPKTDSPKRCTFPSFMQYQDKERKQVLRVWEGRFGNATNATRYQFIAFPHQIKAESSETGAKRHVTLECVEDIFGQMMLVHITPENVYQCLEIKQRSPHVFQWKMSPKDPLRRVEICLSMELNPNIWVSTSANEFVACPIMGNYKMEIVEKAKSALTNCDYINDFVLESNCLRGDYLIIDFKDSQCVPSQLYMNATQKVLCLAAWRNDDISYAIIKHNQQQSYWCLRINSQSEKGSKAIIFRNAHCATGDVSPDEGHLLMILRNQSKPSPYEKLCYDDVTCNIDNSNACQPSATLNYLGCAKSCNICSETMPTMCTIPTAFQGKWRVDVTIFDSPLLVDNDTIHFPDSTRFSCVKWHNGNEPGFGSESQFMLVTKADDTGCRPRYICAHMILKAQSVLLLRITDAQLWPFSNYQQGDVDCRFFHYGFLGDDENNYLVEETKRPITAGSLPFFQNTQFRLLVANLYRQPIQCRLEKREFDVAFTGNIACHGSLMENETSNFTSISMILDRRCRNTMSKQEFACIQSFYAAYMRDLMIITESLSNRGHLNCWLFPSSVEGLFYLLKLSQCYPEIVNHLRNGRAKPLAVFMEHREPANGGAERGNTTREDETDRPVEKHQAASIIPGISNAAFVFLIILTQYRF